MDGEQKMRKKNDWNVSLTAQKNFFSNENVLLQFSNNGKKSVFIMPTLFDSLSFVGKVFQKKGNTFVEVKTFNTRASIIDKAERQLPQPVEVKTLQSQAIELAAAGYQQTGPDKWNDWASFPLKGLFKVKISFQHVLTLWKPTDVVESEVFEIK